MQSNGAVYRWIDDVVLVQDRLEYDLDEFLHLSALEIQCNAVVARDHRFLRTRGTLHELS